MEAQRYPEDYDGVVAGSPDYSLTGEMAGQAWNVRALQQTTTGALPVQKLQLLQQSVTKACGGADGLVRDPRQCSSARDWSARIRVSPNIAAAEMSTGQRIGHVQQNNSC
jgi:hypothetical protein